jgi:hypothetical protein
MSITRETTTASEAAPTTTSTPSDVRIGVVSGREERPIIAFDRSVWLWVAICSVVMFTGVGAGVWAVTGRAIDGVAVGAFTTFWGGPGFGVMFGSAYHALSSERSEKRSKAARAAEAASAHAGSAG